MPALIPRTRFRPAWGSQGRTTLLRGTPILHSGGSDVALPSCRLPCHRAGRRAASAHRGSRNSAVTGSSYHLLRKWPGISASSPSFVPFTGKSISYGARALFDGRQKNQNQKKKSAIPGGTRTRRPFRDAAGCSCAPSCTSAKFVFLHPLRQCAKQTHRAEVAKHRDQALEAVVFHRAGDCNCDMT